MTAELWWLLISKQVRLANFMSGFSAIILGAGTGERMRGIDKIMTTICGLPTILHSVNAFLRTGIFETMTVVANTHNISKLEHLMSSPEYHRVQVILGGIRRQDSVKNALATIDAIDYVVIHDGARPCVSSDLIGRAVKATQNSDAAIPVLPVTDTIKIVREFKVVSNVDRSNLFSTQTPQVFKYSSIAKFHKILTDDVTDDSSLVEISGGDVSTFAGDPENIKITNPIDIEIAETILQRRRNL
jgi:2-C-methyl-D-erythritol 4-phosphate cytidylyltransferase